MFKIVYIYIYISEVGGCCRCLLTPNREIVSFRSCVRCEAVCERETERFVWVGCFSGFVARRRRPPVAWFRGCRCKNQ